MKLPFKPAVSHEPLSTAGATFPAEVLELALGMPAGESKHDREDMKRPREVSPEKTPVNGQIDVFHFERTAFLSRLSAG